MAFPTLNEMLNAINASQQNAFIPSFMEGEKFASEQQYKKAQMEKLLQDIDIASQKLPLEMMQMQASTRNTDASTLINELNARAARTKMDNPLYKQAVQADLENSMLTPKKTQAELDDAYLKQDTAINNLTAMERFRKAPTKENAMAFSPELFANISNNEADNKARLAQARMAANAASSGEPKPEKLSPVERVYRDANIYENEYKKYVDWDPVNKQYTLKKEFRNKDEAKYRERAEQIRKLWYTADQLKKFYTTVYKEESPEIEGFNPKVTTTIKGGGNASVQQQQSNDNNAGYLPGYVKGADGVFRKVEK